MNFISNKATSKKKKLFQGDDLGYKLGPDQEDMNHYYFFISFFKNQCPKLPEILNFTL